jgi:hypothetical protein
MVEFTAKHHPLDFFIAPIAWLAVVADSGRKQLKNC